MLNRARWWLLMRWLPARLFVQGHRDGRCGMRPQLIDNHYYMGGYRLGRDKLFHREA